MRLRHNIGEDQPRPQSFHLGYRPSLDGVRGIAILLVLLAHLYPGHDQFGFVGVDIFFVLSGFLITCLLIEEWDQTKSISLKSFYWRRALRLLPGLIAMLIVFMIYTCLTGSLAIVMKNAVFALEALFYSTNWALIAHLGEPSSHLFKHTWSLSIEEQFYFIWPIILLVLLQKTKSRTSLLWYIVLAALLSNLERIVLVALDNTNNWRFYCGLDTRADSLLLGCCGGIIMSSNLLPQRRWIKSMLQAAALISLLGLYAMAENHLPDSWMHCFGWFLTSLFAALDIVWLAYASEGALHWILESRPLVYVGKISYGLYLWHFPVIHAVARLGWTQWQYASIAILVAATLISYYVIELPFLRQKKRASKTNTDAVLERGKIASAPG